MARVGSILESIAAMDGVVEHHVFDIGDDGVPHLNFTFGTLCAKQLWQRIREAVFGDPELGAAIKKSAIVVCSSESGWHSYSLLAHFDPHVAVDSDADL